MFGSRSTARVLVATFCLVLAAACTGPGRPPVTTTTTSTAPPVPGDLLRWQALGGFCPPSGCGFELRIKTDGSWVTGKGTPPVVTSGRLDAATTAELTRRIDAGIASVAALPPVTGPCQLPPDASEIIYTFTSGGRTVEASNCKQVFGQNALIAYAATFVNRLVFAPPAPSTPVLVEWTSKGGRCPGGVCFRSVQVSADGAVSVRKMDVTARGQLDAATTAELARRIGEQIGTLVNLDKHPRGCPSAHDGQDITYSFLAGDTRLIISNCTQVIPTGNALLDHVDDVLNLPNGPL